MKAWRVEARSLRMQAADLERRVKDADEQALDRQRDKWTAELRAELAARRAELVIVRDVVDTLKRGEAVQRRLGLSRLDRSLANFRSSMRDEYDDLRRAELDLDRQLESLSKKFEVWDDSPAPRIEPPKRVVAKRVEAPKLPDKTVDRPKPSPAKKVDARKVAAEREAREAARAAARAWRFLRDRDAEQARDAAAAAREREVRRANERRAAKLARDRDKITAYRESKTQEHDEPPPPPPPPLPKGALAKHAKRAVAAGKDRRARTLDKTEAASREHDRLKRLAAETFAARAPAPAHDPVRVRRPTSASKLREFLLPDDDLASCDFDDLPAHARPVAGGGYDLKFAGRAVPAWRRQTT